MRRIIATTCVLWLAADAAAGEQWVVTDAGRVDGRIRFVGDRVLVGDEPVRAEKVVMLRRAAVRALPVSLTMTTGERWALSELAYDAGRFDVVGPVVGEQRIDAARVAAVRFAPGATPAKRQTLTRRDGEPVPGKLMWIDAGEVGIASPLGVLRLPRAGAIAYRLADAQPTASGDHEVRFTDGTVLRGKLRFGEGGVTLEHAQLGTLDIDTRRIAAVLAPSRGLKRIGELAATLGPRRSPLGTQQPGRLEPIRDDRAVDAWRIAARTTVEFTLPDAARRARLAGAVVADSGAVRLRIAADGREVFSRQLTGDQPTTINAIIGPAQTLSITVDHAEPLVMPAAVRLLDVHLVGVDR